MKARILVSEIAGDELTGLAGRTPYIIDGKTVGVVIGILAFDVRIVGQLAYTAGQCCPHGSPGGG